MKLGTHDPTDLISFCLMELSTHDPTDLISFCLMELSTHDPTDLISFCLMELKQFVTALLVWHMQPALHGRKTISSVAMQL
jgi:ssRNA-specific RNase YbeY (16S rRNA maturation enzyme)